MSDTMIESKCDVYLIRRRYANVVVGFERLSETEKGELGKAFYRI